MPRKTKSTDKRSKKTTKPSRARASQRVKHKARAKPTRDRELESMLGTVSVVAAPKASIRDPECAELGRHAPNCSCTGELRAAIK